MISLFEAWRRNFWLWVLPLGFCVLNLLSYGLYRSAFAGKVERLEQQLASTDSYLAALDEEHSIYVDFLDRVRIHRERTSGLYGDYFQTEAQRFTRVIQEVKRLARQAGLRPSSLSYPRQDFSGYELVQRNISFGVEGTYDQLRSFINLLELADEFLTLQSVNLGESVANRRDPKLSINLVLSTMFATREFESRVEEEPET